MTDTDVIPEFDLADRIRKSLRHAGLSSQEMADYLGVSRTSVSNWASGRNRPSRPVLRLFAMRCGIDYEWLRTGAGVRIPGFSTLPAVAA